MSDSEFSSSDESSVGSVKIANKKKNLEVVSDDDDDDDSFSESELSNRGDDDDDGEEFDYLAQHGKHEDDESIQNDESESESDEDDDDDEYNFSDNYLQKFDDGIQKNMIEKYHPEMVSHNYHEIEALCRIIRDGNRNIIDPLHRTVPFITRYEYARVIGERAMQINAGAKPLIDVGEHIVDGYVIAVKEFEQKKIPFILKRPLPNGGCEYWKVSDLS